MLNDILGAIIFHSLWPILRRIFHSFQKMEAFFAKRTFYCQKWHCALPLVTHFTHDSYFASNFFHPKTIWKGIFRSIMVIFIDEFSTPHPTSKGLVLVLVRFRSHSLLGSSVRGERQLDVTFGLHSPGLICLDRYGY